MSKEKTPTLGDVLANPVHPGRDVRLFLPATEVWSLSVPALVVCFDDIDEDAEDVERRTGFQYALLLSTVQDNIRNATQQLRSPTREELLRAFLFYHDRDAFIDFNNSPE